MSHRRSTLVSELQQLLDEMKASHAVFSATQVRAASILDQLSENSDTAVQPAATAKEDPFDLNPDFEKLLEEELSGGANADHYVERPFLDPYDCFDDSAPEVGFPLTSRHHGTGRLEGLFESDHLKLEQARSVGRQVRMSRSSTCPMAVIECAARRETIDFPPKTACPRSSR